MASQTLHFSIDGAFMTDHARNLVLEGRWDHAMRTLVDGLEGMSTDIAISILKGDAKLVGVNDLDLEDDDATKYKADLDYQFAGVFADTNGRFLRPYAVVTSWGRDDLLTGDARTDITNNARGSQMAVVTSLGRNTYRQPLHYADNPATDIALEADIDTGQVSESRGGPLGKGEMVLCRVVTNFPHLIYSHHGTRAIKEAIAALYARGIQLKEVGAGDEPEEAPATSSLEEIRSVARAAARQINNESFEERVARQNRELAERFQRDETIKEYRKLIIEQAGGDTFPLTYAVKGVEKTVQVPTAPFENWSLWRTSGASLAKPWKTISPSGLKMQGDDPYHTDWMLGAGLNLHDMEEDGSTLHEVAFAENFRMQEDLLDFAATVLCGDQEAYGEVVHPRPGESVDPDKIAVIPVAGPRYLQAAMTARAVITEQGGAMAHLVSIGREKGVTIMRVENARKLYPVGSKVTLNPRSGSARLAATPVRDAFGNYEDM